MSPTEAAKTQREWCAPKLLSVLYPFQEMAQHPVVATGWTDAVLKIRRPHSPVLETYEEMIAGVFMAVGNKYRK